MECCGHNPRHTHTHHQKGWSWISIGCLIFWFASLYVNNTIPFNCRHVPENSQIVCVCVFLSPRPSWTSWGKLSEFLVPQSSSHRIAIHPIQAHPKRAATVRCHWSPCNSFLSPKTLEPSPRRCGSERHLFLFVIWINPFGMISAMDLDWGLNLLNVIYSEENSGDVPISEFSRCEAWEKKSFEKMCWRLWMVGFGRPMACGMYQITSKNVPRLTSTRKLQHQYHITDHLIYLYHSISTCINRIWCRYHMGIEIHGRALPWLMPRRASLVSWSTACCMAPCGAPGPGGGVERPWKNPWEKARGETRCDSDDVGKIWTHFSRCHHIQAETWRISTLSYQLSSKCFRCQYLGGVKEVPKVPQHYAWHCEDWTW